MPQYVYKCPFVGSSNSCVAQEKKCRPSGTLLSRQNHRMGLFDMFLVKDNHIDALGGLGAALEQLEQHLKTLTNSLPVVVEIRALEELEIALQFPWIDRVMLDNLPP